MRMRHRNITREIIETIVLAAVIFFAMRFVLQSYFVQDVGMQPNINVGSDVLVNKTAYLFHAPQRGDVIVFHYPFNTSKNLIRRIIGVPGDTIKTDDTHIWVNNVLLNEPYVSKSANPQANQWKVPVNSYFVLSDNRPDSDDSRTWGIVPKNFIIGKAVMIYWPTKTWGFINTYTGVFGKV